jgi:hypothetical protein
MTSAATRVAVETNPRRCGAQRVTRGSEYCFGTSHPKFEAWGFAAVRHYSPTLIFPGFFPAHVRLYPAVLAWVGVRVGVNGAKVGATTVPPAENFLKGCRPGGCCTSRLSAGNSAEKRILSLIPCQHLHPLTSGNCHDFSFCCQVASVIIWQRSPSWLSECERVGKRDREAVPKH